MNAQAERTEEISPVDAIISENTELLIHRNGDSKFLLAEALGLTPSALSHKLKRRRPWFAHEIDVIAHRYDVSHSALYTRLNLPSLVPTIVGSASNVIPLKPRGAHASVAQWIEHWFPVPGVARSNRVGGTLIDFPTAPVKRGA